MICSSCGADAGPGKYCPQCGAEAHPSAYPSHEQPAASSRSQTGIIVGAVVAVVVVLCLVAVGGFLLLRGSGGEKDARLSADSSPAASASPTPESPAPATVTATVTPKPKKQAGGPGAVSALPSGLFCRDLMTRGYSYAAAADYWRMHGQPNQMDADRNGIPCETVYSPTDVSAYWSVRELPPAAAVDDSLPAGLLCRDLLARGLNYNDAVSYWFEEGAPDRMDADHNGIPCGTVYPSYVVDTYWGPGQYDGE